MGGNIGRGVLDLDPAADGEVVVLELSVLPDRAGAGAAAGHRGLPEPVAGPSRPARRPGRVFRGQAAAVHRRRAGRGRSSASTRSRGGSWPTRMREEAGTGDPVITRLGDAQARRGRAGGLRPQGVSRRMARRAAGGVDRPAGDGEAAGRAQPPERLRRLCGGAQPRAGAAAIEAAARELSRACRTAPAGRRPGAACASSTTPRRRTPTRRRRRCGSFERIRWIAGGRAKEGGIEPLRPLFGRVAKAYLIGEAAREFAATIGDAARGLRHDGGGGGGGAAPRRSRATPCCWRRPAPASTSSRASRRAARRSRRWCGRADGGRQSLVGVRVPNLRWRRIASRRFVGRSARARRPRGAGHRRRPAIRGA